MGREFGKDCFSISSFASFSLITLNTILNVITNIDSNINDNNNSNDNNNNNNANTNMNLGRRRRHVNTTQGAEERCGHMSPSSLSTIGQRVREAATRRHLAWIQNILSEEPMCADAAICLLRDSNVLFDPLNLWIKKIANPEWCEKMKKCS